MRSKLIKDLNLGDLSKANALAKKLADIAPRTGSGRRRGNQRPKLSRGNPREPAARVDIVSESLCDDVIKYLAPTLEKHKRCSLVDLQPGACLFSSKLHDFLKPKRHLLIEPEDHYYEPFIKPLLDKPDSTYRYTQLNISHSTSYWDEFRRIQRDPTLLPPRPPLSIDDPRRRQFDPSVLIIGNLARQIRLSVTTHGVDQPPLTLYRLGFHALANQYFQNAGLVRMLLWMPEAYKPTINSRLPYDRSGFNVGLSMGLKLTETVSVQSVDSIYLERSNDSRQRRQTGLLEDLSKKAVRDEMRKAGMAKPQRRQLQTQPSSLNKSQKSIACVSPYQLTIKSAPNLRAKVDKTLSCIQEMFSWVRGKHTIDEQALATIVYPQAAVGVQHLPKYYQTRTNMSRLTVLVDLYLRIFNLEANFKELENTISDEKVREKLRTDIIALSDEFNRLLEEASILAKPIVHELVEDQLGFFLSPSTLTVYDRSYEPLKADPEEFWPKQNLALFDAVPKERDLAVPDLAGNAETTRFCTQLLRVLFTSRSSSVPQALDKIGVNAAKDLIPMVPAITDARRGGRLNPHNLRVRMITEEMVEGIVKAFFEWPFRPQSWELALTDSDLEVANESEHQGKAET